jgi:hypothetical protein
MSSTATTKYWQDQGWDYVPDRMEMDGYYRTHRGSFKGKIALSHSGDHQYFVYNPPPALKRHEHGACFVDLHRDGLHFVHFRVKPLNVDAGILAIELIFRETLELYA